jgi:ubiquinone/menaquinone biosynthesis C-methylase UbiE
MAFSQRAIIDHYAKAMFEPLTDLYFEQSGFFNVGLWGEDTDNQAVACERLVDALVGSLNRNGHVLDIACGKGGTTKRLLRFWSTSDIVAINISDRELEAARWNAPGCDFRNMDATTMAFDDESFDDIICVESAFHFNTRETFLKEAYRVLNPGGRIALTDMLLPRWLCRLNLRLAAENWLPNIAAYHRVLELVGFENIDIQNITDQSLTPFSRHLRKWLSEMRTAGKVNFLAYARTRVRFLLSQWFFKAYLKVSANKPASG